MNRPRQTPRLRPIVGCRVELQRGSKLLSGTVESADDRYASIRWDQGGATTIRFQGLRPRVIAEYGLPGHTTD
jgi:hypothetical protein